MVALPGTMPLSGRKTPERILIRVDLPAPSSLMEPHDLVVSHVQIASRATTRPNDLRMFVS